MIDQTTRKFLVKFSDIFGGALIMGAECGEPGEPQPSRTMRFLAVTASYIADLIEFLAGLFTPGENGA